MICSFSAGRLVDGSARMMLVAGGYRDTQDGGGQACAGRRGMP